MSCRKSSLFLNFRPHQGIHNSLTFMQNKKLLTGFIAITLATGSVKLQAGDWTQYSGQNFDGSS